jgi:hypothetical protein
MEISSQIMTLIDETKEELVIVSPYIKIRTWNKIKKCLQRAVDRGVNITVYARKNADQDLTDLIHFKVKLVLIQDLHAKIYLNENYAIVSSQNMIEYSDENSIDFAYSTETDLERFQLDKLINQYLKIHDLKNEVDFEEKTKNLGNENSNSQDFDYKEFLKDFEIKKIFDVFQEKYKTGRINNPSTYVFCNKIFYFGDVMFREGYEIRFNHNQLDFVTILKTLKELNLKNLNYKYSINCKMKNNHPDTMIIIPQKFDNIDKLIEDYIELTELIHKETSKYILVK